MRDDRNAYRRRSFRNRINESYVKCIAIRTFKLPFYNYIYALRPLIVGMMPERIYDVLHRRRSKSR